MTDTQAASDRKPGATERFQKEFCLDLYRRMVTIRDFENELQDLYTRTLFSGIAHYYIGQEAVAVGVCAALEDDDYISSTHRGHGHTLAKGAEIGPMYAELLGKADGYCRGKGGSMHIANPDKGNLGANGIVGGGIPIATGAAFSAKVRKTKQVAVSFFGDGASNEGVLYECMNMATIWRLPIIYVCENNFYGEYTPMERVTAGNLQQRGEAFDIPSETADGMNVLEVYQVSQKAVTRARAGEGPSLLVLETYRYKGHGMSDRDRPYRTREEEEQWRDNRDPIDNFAQFLLNSGQVTTSELETIQNQIKQDIEQAIAFAENAPSPEPQEAKNHVYAD